MIDFEKFRYDIKGHPGKFEDWLESMFQSIFSVQGFEAFEKEYDLLTRVYVLKLMIGMYSYYDENQKAEYCESLYDTYVHELNKNPQA